MELRTVLISMMAVAVAVAAMAAASCDRPAASEDDEGSATVVASFYPLAEAARQAGADGADVIELTPPGVEPHDLELTPDDIEAIATADVVLYLGGGFQPAVEDAVGEATGIVVDVGSGLATLPPPADEHAEEEGEEEAEEHGELTADPHVWLDPTRYAAMAGEVARALDQADGGAATVHADAVRPFEQQLEDLDAEFRDGLADCDSRLLVVNHAAFGYLAEAYGLEQQAISGVAPEAEPDPRRLAELRELVIDEGVTTVFVESLVSQGVGTTLAEEAGVTTAVLDPLEGLTPERIDAGEDYVSIMHENLEALRRGLGCR